MRWLTHRRDRSVVWRVIGKGESQIGCTSPDSSCAASSPRQKTLPIRDRMVVHMSKLDDSHQLHSGDPICLVDRPNQALRLLVTGASLTRRPIGRLLLLHRLFIN